MRLSIITVTYNAENFLAEALNSVASQEYDDYEHVLWDGGSTDQTLEIAAQFPRVRIFQGSDAGIADAMNKGASQARGDFILHLHADDRLPHSRVLKQVSITLKQRPQVSWLYGRANIIDSHGNCISKGDFHRFDRKRLKKYNFISHPATWISRELFERSRGFNRDLKYCMDYDLWLRLSNLTTPYALSAHIADFREHELSCSTSHPMGVADEAYLVRNRYIHSLWQKIRSHRTWKRRRASIIKAARTDCS